MPQPGNLTREETLSAWAEIVIQVWRDKITEMKIWDTGQLYHSFRYELFKSAGNDVEKIEFSYEIYGYFVDMGVGREMPVGNIGEVSTSRVRKRWYSGVFYFQVMKLKEILTEKFGEGIANQVASALRPRKDLKSK